MENSSIPGEIGLGFGIVVITALLFFVVKMVFQSTTVLQKRFTELLPYTAIASSGKIILQQDTNKDANATPILSSDNERTGIEFAYSFFLLVNEDTIDGTDVLRTVFYKGYDNGPWPLLAPGVFIRGNTNTMRIVYNSSTQPYNYIDVENIPIGKYFHVVLNYKSNALEIHINGHITKKLTFEGGIPYSNYSNVSIFGNTRDLTITRPTLPSIQFKGAINGQISNLMYTRYALSYSEINNLLSKGPSDMIKQKETEVPPYLAASWWVTDQ